MTTLRELDTDEGPNLGRTLTLSDDDAQSLIALEKRRGLHNWEIVDPAASPAKKK